MARNGPVELLRCRHRDGLDALRLAFQLQQGYVVVDGDRIVAVVHQHLGNADDIVLVPAQIMAANVDHDGLGLDVEDAVGGGDDPDAADPGGAAEAFGRNQLAVAERGELAHAGEQFQTVLLTERHRGDRCHGPLQRAEEAAGTVVVDDRADAAAGGAVAYLVGKSVVAAKNEADVALDAGTGLGGKTAVHQRAGKEPGRRAEQVGGLEALSGDGHAENLVHQRRHVGPLAGLRFDAADDARLDLQR